MKVVLEYGLKSNESLSSLSVPYVETSTSGSADRKTGIGLTTFGVFGYILGACYSVFGESVIDYI